MGSLPVWAWNPVEVPPPLNRSHVEGYGLECQNYDVIAQGTYLGCHMENITGLPDEVVVTVNGISSTSTVPCSDAFVDLKFEGRPAAHCSLPVCTGPVCLLCAFSLHWSA